MSVGRTGDASDRDFWFDQGDWGIKLGYSSEDDYQSRYGNVYYGIDLNQKQTNLLFSTSLSDDTVWNSYNPDVLLESPTQRNSRQKREWMFSINQIINRYTVVEAKLTHVQQKGELSDPYKKSFVVDEGIIDFRGLVDVAGLLTAFVDAGLIDFLNDSGITRLLNQTPFIDVPELSELFLGLYPDTRPSNREQWILALRTSRHIPTLDSSIHLDYRYADDSWDANSHTLEVTWNWAIDGWIISTGLRYYSQSNAFFYATFHETVPDHGAVSSDYRLAGFGARSYKLAVHKTLRDRFILSAHLESYERRHQWQLGDPFHSSRNSVGDDLDDFKFTLFSVGIDVLF